MTCTVSAAGAGAPSSGVRVMVNRSAVAAPEVRTSTGSSAVHLYSAARACSGSSKSSSAASIIMRRNVRFWVLFILISSFYVWGSSWPNSSTRPLVAASVQVEKATTGPLPGVRYCTACALM